MATDPAFWQGRRVLLTGHTGFKGGWAAAWLASMGAEVTGFALAPPAHPNLFDLIGHRDVTSIIGDLREEAAIAETVEAARPEIVLHLAAQPLVRESYRDPVGTFGSNVMGTVHLLNALVRRPAQVCLIVTTDKVYENDERGVAFREDDRLGGHDPYAASKAATEIAVTSFRRSFFEAACMKLATARGGNVIGGGDFSADRLVPDIVRAARAGHAPTLRNPQATRPWQHVLDCLDGYFTFVQALWQRNDLPHALNIGPHDPTDTMTVEAVTHAMNTAIGLPGDWTLDQSGQPHEMSALALDPALACETIGWQGRLNSAEAIRLTADWYAAWTNGADMTRFTLEQLHAYQERKESAR